MNAPAVFFMHLPKTGGMTVEKFLTERIPSVGPWYYDGEFFSGDGRPEDFQLVRGHLPYFVSQAVGEEVFRITWFREPIARTLSAFKHFLRDREHPLHAEIMRHASTVARGFEIREVRITLTNPMTRFLGADLDFASLIEDVRAGRRKPGEAGQIAARVRRQEATWETLERARERLESLDFVGFTERMDESLVRLAERLGVAAPERSERVNVSWSHQTLGPDNLSPESLDVIREATSLDRRLFEWAAEREGLIPTDNTVSSAVSPLLDIGQGADDGEQSDHPPIFCAGLYGSGTSLLWSLLRHHPDVKAFYEPTHANLADRLLAGNASTEGESAYTAEYATVPEGVRNRHQRVFGVSRLHLGGEDVHDELKDYLKGLIHAAAPKCPVMTLTQDDFRIPWLRARFPDARIIYMKRNPRGGWASFMKTGLGKESGTSWMTRAGPEFLAWVADTANVMPELLHDEIDSSYARYYLLWRLSTTLAERYADLVIDYDSEFLPDPRGVVNRIMKSRGLSPADLPDEVLSLVKSRHGQDPEEHVEGINYEQVEKQCDELFRASGLAEKIAEGVLNSRWPERLAVSSSELMQRIMTELLLEVSRTKERIADRDAVNREMNVYIESLRANYEELQEISKELHASIEESAAYAESLEKGRAEATEYAWSLEKALRESREYAESLEKERGESTEYARSLEHALKESQTYAQSLARERAESDEYVASLERALREAREYGSSLEKELQARDGGSRKDGGHTTNRDE